jgi:lysophospholipase L1-like esterase
MFEEEFRAFARAEAAAPVMDHPILFYGSSSIRLWDTLMEDFPCVPVVNRGFGGSTLRECVAAMERLVFHLEPRAIVLYAGENDLDHGTSPEDVQDQFEEFVTQADDRLGMVPLIFISIKPSPARWWNVGAIRRTNALIRPIIAAWPQARYLDVFPHMLQADGAYPRRELYAEDGLHMSRNGYLLWATHVRGCLRELGLYP